MPTVLVCFDIDGVFSLTHMHHQYGWLKKEHLSGISIHPAPLTNALLRLIEQDPMLYPAWLSSWGPASVAWNERAGTKKWPVIYPLDFNELAQADRMFGSCLHNVKPDNKLIAVRWQLYQMSLHLHAKPDAIPVVWVEDGFAPETLTWQNERRVEKQAPVQLVDTRNSAILDMLAQKCADKDECVQSARAFMTKWIDAKVTV